MYEVLSPLGDTEVTEVNPVGRPSDLNNKTVCEVINGAFKSDIALPVIREMLQKRYPGIKIIPYSEFPVQWVMGSTQDLLQRVDTTVAHLVEKGCDAVITGVGG